MRFVIVTGLSGAGKSHALRSMEDIGFFCVDNLPLSMLSDFVKFCASAKNKIQHAAVVLDVRAGERIEDMVNIADGIKELGVDVDLEILFLDAMDASLVRRFKATHRAHPLSRSYDLIGSIAKERKMLHSIKTNASHVIDTSNLSINQLTQIINEMFTSDDYEKKDNLLIFVTTFGFKRGIPLDADLVFDVRFLPNPYYVEELKPFSGQNDLIQKYIFEFPKANEFMEKLYDMVEFLVPLHIGSGKDQLKIAIGCTGGMHRSVAVAELLYAKLQGDGYHVIIGHRDILLDGTTKR